MSPREAITKEFFEKALGEHLSRLYGMAMRLTRNRDDAEDLVADSVAKAWASRGTLKEKKAFRSWIFRIMTNAFISSYRKKGREVILEAPGEPGEAGDSEFSLFDKIHQPVLLWWSNPEREFLNKILREDLEKALNTLPDEYRIVVILAELEGFSYQEAAKIAGVPVGTIRSRLARGRGMLQKALWEHGKAAGLVKGGQAGERNHEKAKNNQL